MSHGFDQVMACIERIKQGGMIILVDEEDRENEGDLVCAAQTITPEQVNFMAQYGRGLICLALEPEQVDKLDLPLMQDSRKAGARLGTAFTVSIEAKEGVTTGISAADRAHTMRLAADPHAKSCDFVVPGHVFPLRAREGGVLARSGHTEGSVDLVKLAGFNGAAVICEIMNTDGSMARWDDLQKLAQQFNLPILSITDLIRFRLSQESHIKTIEQASINTEFGILEAYLLYSELDQRHHLAWVKGQPFGDQVVDVRVHAQRPFSDIWGGRFLELSPRIKYASYLLKHSERAVFVYLTLPQRQAELRQEFLEITQSWMNPPSRETKAIELTPAKSFMDDRQIGVGAQILRHLGVHNMRVHSSSKTPYKGLAGFGLNVIEHVSLRPDNIMEGDDE